MHAVLRQLFVFYDVKVSGVCKRFHFSIIPWRSIGFSAIPLHGIACKQCIM